MLAEVPIDGLEAHYRSHTDEQTALYRRLAAEKGSSSRSAPIHTRHTAGESPPLARHLGHGSPRPPRHRRAGSGWRIYLGAGMDPLAPKPSRQRT